MDDTARKSLEASGAKETLSALLPLYSLALFASALLAFWIQPLFAKLVLPRYGGSPAVWTTASLFFQVMLLGGYLYAHLLARTPLRTQLVLHSLIVCAALVSLPVNVAAVDSSSTAPVLSLLIVLAVSLGLPFFALSATAPLLQQWFSRTGHPHAGDPYFLYSASNAGSLAALIGYPLLLEPMLGLRQQTILWSLSCGVFGALLVACAAAVWRRRAAPAALGAVAQPAAAPLPWRDRARWMVLAFAPSSLMLGVTQHITSEIAAAPLLWLVPLTLYVLTFVLVFARRQVIPASATERVQPMLVIVLALAWPLNHYTSVLVLHLAVFAVTALMCHAELARTRPDVEHLTAFYLCIAVGGAAGGAFNALVAPVAFDSVLEYPLALALACALRRPPQGRTAFWSAPLPALALAAGFVVLYATGFRPFTYSAWSAVVYLQVIGLALYMTHRKPVQFALALLVVLLATPIVHLAERVLERHRSFFGVHSVLLDDSRKFHVLMHGITIHGAQRIDPERRLTPTTYFHADSPVAQLFSVLGRGDALRRVAVVGLGVGTLACHRAPGREFTFYEIDPVVVRLAQDQRYFSFLSGCAPNAPIVLGDGRLTLARAPDAAYDLIIMDSFASDAIPVHLITREALALYLTKVGERGVVLFNVTNQYMDIVPVLARLARDAKVTAVVPGPRFDIALDDRLAALPSMWVAIVRDPQRLAPLVAEEYWIPIPEPPSGRVWTDDFSNVLSALK